MAEIDDLLSTTLKRVAEPGDPAGVADSIRSRMDAGDTGTPTSSSGFGSPVRRWWPWLSVLLIIVLLGVGALSAALGRSSPPLALSPVPTATATPTGSPSSAPAASQAPSPTATADPDPDPAPAPPAPAPAPPPPADTTPPVIQSASATPATVYSSNGTPTTVSAVATDDSGVVSVEISWSGYFSGSGQMQPAWTFIIDPPPGPPVYGSLIVTLQAFDAAGNGSAPVKFVVAVEP
jgi:hypothetical protein